MLIKSWIKANATEYSSRQKVIQISSIVVFAFFHLHKAQKMLRPVAFSIKGLWNVHLESVVHPHVMFHSLEIVIPTQSSKKKKKESFEAIAQEHLHLFKAI